LSSLEDSLTDISETPELSPVHNTDAARFEIERNGHLAVLEYEFQGGKMLFMHTGVPSALERQGIGSRLARAGLDYARTQGLQVVPLCSFIAGYIRKHPEYQDLVE
jgi:predicted GNAT family acetyltransferase